MLDGRASSVQLSLRRAVVTRSALVLQGIQVPGQVNVETQI